MHHKHGVLFQMSVDKQNSQFKLAMHIELGKMLHRQGPIDLENKSLELLEPGCHVPTSIINIILVSKVQSLKWRMGD